MAKRNFATYLGTEIPVYFPVSGAGTLDKGDFRLWSVSQKISHAFRLEHLVQLGRGDDFVVLIELKAGQHRRIKRSESGGQNDTGRVHRLPRSQVGGESVAGFSSRSRVVFRCTKIFV